MRDRCISDLLSRNGCRKVLDRGILSLLCCFICLKVYFSGVRTCNIPLYKPFLNVLHDPKYMHVQHGRLGEQVRSNIENWLKFGHSYRCLYL